MNKADIEIFSNDPLCKYLTTINQLFRFHEIESEINLEITKIIVVDYYYYIAHENDIELNLNLSNYRVILYNTFIKNIDFILVCFRKGFHSVIGRENIYIELSIAVQKILKNEVYYPDFILHEVFKLQSTEKKNLTKREHNVYLLLRNGLSYKEIAFDMKLSINTIKFYANSIYKKLNIHTRFELIKYFNGQYS